MFRKIYVKRRLAILSGIIMTLAFGTAVYGFEEGGYHEFRDGDISIYLPLDWASDESYADEAQGSEAGTPEEIFTARDESGDSGLELAVYYVMEEARSNDYFYIDNDEDAALEYYDAYGVDAIHDVCHSIVGKEDATASFSSGGSGETFFDGQWNGFVVTDVAGEVEYMSGEVMDHFSTCYLTCRMTDNDKYVVTSALVFQNDGKTALTKAQKALAKEVADEFYDYDYYNVMAGIKPSDYLFDDEAESNFGTGPLVTILIGIAAFLAPIAIIAVVVIIAVKRLARRMKGNVRGGWNSRSRQDSQDKGAKSFSAGFTGIQQSFDLGDTIGKFKKRRAEKNSFSGREQRSERRTEQREERREARREERQSAMRAERRSTVQMRTHEAESAERRYYESLQTLLKTGLLTKEEMRDMLERHERSRTRQRNR